VSLCDLVEPSLNNKQLTSAVQCEHTCTPIHELREESTEQEDKQLLSPPVGRKMFLDNCPALLLGQRGQQSLMPVLLSCWERRAQSNRTNSYSCLPSSLARGDKDVSLDNNHSCLSYSPDHLVISSHIHKTHPEITQSDLNTHA
jgi:hypothetical protein